MAVVNVEEKWSDVNGDLAQATGAMAYRWTAVKAFTVLFDAAATPLDAIAATGAGLPSMGDIYDAGHTFLILQRKRALPIGPLLFEVLCEYGGKDSPLFDPYEKAWMEAISTEPVDVDQYGNALVNPVGDRYIVTREVSDPVYVLTRNEASYPSANAQAYRNSVNTDVFLTWPANTARMRSITARRIVEGATYFWKVTYRIQFREDRWKRRIVQEGRRYSYSALSYPMTTTTGGAVGGTVPSDGDLIVARDALGVDTVYLNNDGTLRNAALGPIYDYKHVYTLKAFAPLGLS